MRIFNETQVFDQWWLQLMNLAMVGFLVYSHYTWHILAENVGNVAADDRQGQIISSLVLIGVLLLFYVIRLKTHIDEKGITYRFVPFHRKPITIPWRDIKSCEVRKYSPLKEYGGWGLKYGLKGGKAVNVKGNMGIQLLLHSGKKILIGTQKPKAAKQTIRRYGPSALGSKPSSE